MVKVICREYKKEYNEGINNIPYIYSSRPRNPGVIWHNFGVTVITSGLWTYGNPHSYRFFQSTNSGSTWNNLQSYAT